MITLYLYFKIFEYYTMLMSNVIHENLWCRHHATIVVPFNITGILGNNTSIDIASFGHVCGFVQTR